MKFDILASAWIRNPKLPVYVEQAVSIQVIVFRTLRNGNN